VRVLVVAETNVQLRLSDWRLETDDDDVTLVCLNNARDHYVRRLLLDFSRTSITECFRESCNLIQFTLSYARVISNVSSSSSVNCDLTFFCGSRNFHEFVHTP